MDAAMKGRRAYIISLALLLITTATIMLYGRGREMELSVGNLEILPLMIDDWVGEEITEIGRAHV